MQESEKKVIKVVSLVKMWQRMYQVYLVPFGSNYLIFMGFGAGLHVSGDFLEKKKKRKKIQDLFYLKKTARIKVNGIISFVKKQIEKKAQVTKEKHFQAQKTPSPFLILPPL